MSMGDEAITKLVGQARHAANNLAMVLLVNLESAVAGIAEGTREARQATRALEAARAYDGLSRAVLGLWRDERVTQPRAEHYLAEILPLLSLAAERRLALEVEEPGTVLEVRRPALDLALLRFAAAMPRGAGAALRLRGGVLEAGWDADEATRELLGAAGAAAELFGEGVALRLPQPAAARP